MVRTGAALAFVLVVAGCGSTVGTIPVTHAIGTSGESVVVGWVQTPFMGDAPMFIVVDHETTARRFIIQCDNPGGSCAFYVSLPPGGYRIQRVGGSSETRTIDGTTDVTGHARLEARFDVAPGRVVYVGALRFFARNYGKTTETPRPKRTQQTIGGEWLVLDAEKEALSYFNERFPRITEPVVKSLIVTSDMTRRREAVEKRVLDFDARAGTCAGRRVVSLEPLPAESSTLGGGERWVERWTVARCGKTITYRVVVSEGLGGTRLDIREITASP